MASSKQPKEADSESNLDVDYVISYEFADTQKSEAVQQFNELIEALAGVGLATEARNGEGQSVLVFVRLESVDHLYDEVYRSRVKDWLNGVRVTAPESQGEKTLEAEPLTKAERLRIIYQLMSNPPREGGAGITPKSGRWQNVESIFALHDRAFNKAWLKKMTHSTMLKIEDLDEIRNHLGEKVAFYFAFTQAYFTALIAISAFGAAGWFLLGSFSPVYAVVNSLLCVGFIEYWKYQQQDLAIRWDVQNVGRIETRRRDFVPDRQIVDPVTGEDVQFFPAPKRLLRQLLQIPFALAAALALGTLICLCFTIEIFLSEIYNGPGKSVLVFLPTGIIASCQPLLLGYLTGMAEKLTLYENHATDGGFEYAMTQKVFVLNFITSYLGILLTAFVYVPFASMLVPYLDVFNLTAADMGGNDQQMMAKETGFQINPDRLKKQVIYYTVTAQVVNQVLEVIVPYLKRKGLTKVKEMKTKRTTKRTGTIPDPPANDPPEETEFLKRVRHEASLEEYDVTVDFREMVIQYGYLSMFSVVWPLTPISFLINNWIELRTDFIKISLESKRPTPWRAENIGPWIDSLGFLTWLGSITTAAISYMFSNGGLGPGGSPSALKGWVLLLTIFFSEHSYLVVQWLAQLFISKLDSPGRQKSRRERFQVRKKYLEESLGRDAANVGAGSKQQRDERSALNRELLEDEARQDSMQSATPVDRFWRRQRGWQETAQTGVGLIEKSKSGESKKQQ